MSLKNKQLWKLFLNYLNNTNEGYLFNFDNHEEKIDLMKTIKIHLGRNTKDIYTELPENIFNVLLNNLNIENESIKNSLYKEIITANTQIEINNTENIIVCSKNGIMDLSLVKGLTSFKQNIIKNTLNNNDYMLTNQYIRKYVPGAKIYAVLDNDDISILSNKKFIKENNKINFYEYCTV